mgnify:CR=1 FL=1
MSICKDCDYYDSCSLPEPNNKCYGNYCKKKDAFEEGTNCMNKQEYYWNVDLLGLLEDMMKVIPGCEINDGYFRSCIDDLKERLDKMFDGERKETE